MELLKHFLDFFLHLDHHLSDILQQYGTATYIILFLIIFVETGLVVMPFLPGDSLLFVAGYFASRGDLNFVVLLLSLFGAACLGDALNYSLGKFFGKKVFSMNIPFVKQEYYDQTNSFYEKYGVKTIIIARFIPIVRTFAPFVAGIGSMNYKVFFSYNLIGGALWVSSMLALGYFFGDIPIVQKNFELVVFGIIFISILPPIVEVIKHKFFTKGQN